MYSLVVQINRTCVHLPGKNEYEEPEAELGGGQTDCFQLSRYGLIGEKSFALFIYRFCRETCQCLFFEKYSSLLLPSTKTLKIKKTRKDSWARTLWWRVRMDARHSLVDQVQQVVQRPPDLGSLDLGLTTEPEPPWLGAGKRREKKSHWVKHQSRSCGLVDLTLPCPRHPRPSSWVSSLEAGHRAGCL